MSKREIKLYIEDIKEAISKIERYTDDLNFDSFAADEKTIDAVVRNLSVIGEAVRNLPEELKNKYPDIPWYEILGMRNRVVHEYFGINEKILWKTIKEDLPIVKSKISTVAE